jgi:hypothetical protein
MIYSTPLALTATYDSPTRNEHRADLAEAAISCATDAEAQDVERDDIHAAAYQDVSDLLANLIHFCHRAGLDWETLLGSAERAAEGDLEDGPEAARDTDRFPAPREV